MRMRVAVPVSWILGIACLTVGACGKGDGSSGSSPFPWAKKSSERTAAAGDRKPEKPAGKGPKAGREANGSGPVVLEGGGERKPIPPDDEGRIRVLDENGRAMPDDFEITEGEAGPDDGDEDGGDPDAAHRPGGVVTRRAGEGAGRTKGGGMEAGGAAGPSSPQGPLRTGPRTTLATGQVGAEGGTIRVDRRGDPLDGLAIEVPAGAYAEPRTVTVSSAPVVSHGLGAAFAPLLPAIVVDGAHDRADAWMRVRVPVRPPAGRFAIAFTVDAESGRLDALRQVGAADGTFVLETSHFSEVVVGSVSEAEIDARSEVTSGFKPGVDNWQFTNRGTYLAPGGICAGMTLSAMWYYDQKTRKGRDPLYGHYDNDWVWKTPTVEHDDVEAYKLASVAQRDYWEGRLARLVLGFEAVTPASVTFRLFKTAMWLTGEPQLVVVGGKDAQGKRFRHALIAFRVAGDRVFVCDPNDPRSAGHALSVASGSWTPYPFGARLGDEDGTPCPEIEYVARSSVLSESTLRAHFGEMMDKTIAKGRFPEFTLEARNASGEWVPFVDEYRVPTSGFELRAVTTPYLPADLFVYDEQEHLIGDGTRDPHFFRKGRQRLGVYVRHRDMGWVGFRWVHVIYSGQQELSESALAGGVSVNGQSRDFGKSAFRLVTEQDGTRTLVFELDQDTKTPYVLAVREFAGVKTYPVNPPSLPLGDTRNVWKEGGASWTVNVGGTLSVQRWVLDDVRFTFDVTFTNPANGHTRRVRGDGWLLR